MVAVSLPVSCWKSGPSVTLISVPPTNSTVTSVASMVVPPGAVAVTVPVVMVLSAPLSGSETSLPSTVTVVGPASSVMVLVSATACGRSSAPLIVMVRVAVSCAPPLSWMV